MINTKLYCLYQILKELPIGKYSCVKSNFIELISDDSNIISELNKLKCMNNFSASLQYKDSNNNFYLVRIFQFQDMASYNIEKIVYIDFKTIFAKYGDSIDFIYCPNKYSIIIETEDLCIIQEIYTNILKNYEYAQFGDMHIFKYIMIEQSH